MQLAKINNLISKNNNGITRIKPLSFDIGLSLLYMLLIILGVFSNIATITAFLLIAVVFYTLPLENIISQMLFLISFAVLFKLSPGSTSLFTIVEFYVVVLMLWRKPSFKANELLWLVLLALSVFVGFAFNYNPQILYFLKFFAALLLVMGFKNSDCQTELPNYIIMFILGLVFSSAIAYFGDDIAQINQYIVKDRVVDSNWQGHFYTDTVRFSGLNADPNYYSINLYIGIIGALVLDSKGVFKNRIWVYASVAALFFFGLQTVSKSFAFMAIGIVMYAFVVCIKNRRYGLLGLFSVAVAVFVVLSYMGKIELVNSMADRIMDSLKEGNLTTGRTGIWSKYFDFLRRNPVLVPFGAGFGYGFGGLIAAHNSYVESLACLGVVGTLLFLCFICVLFSKTNKTQKRSLENYSVLLIILVMYFFLSILTWVDLPVHLFLCYCFMNYKAPKQKIG